MGLLDWLIRNQGVLSGAFAVIVVGVGGWRVTGRPGTSARQWFDRKSGRVQLALTLLGFPALAVLVFLLGLLLGPKEIVSRTYALEPPEPLCGREVYDGLLVFIHGWNGDPEKTWEEFPQLVCCDDAFETFEVVSVSYPTFMARRNARISQLADWLNRSLTERFADRKELRFGIIAHSMGGLIAREIVTLRGFSASDQQVGVLVEIGTPHRGANPARLARSLGLSEELTGDMEEGSSFLTALQVHWNRLSPRPPTFCYSSPQDSVVSETSALFQCDSLFTYPQWGHSEMVKPAGPCDDRYRFPTRDVLKALTPASTGS